MEKKERSGPLVVDAEYKVVGDARHRGVALENVNVHPIVKGGFKLAVRGVFWVVKQTGSFMVEGIKGAMSGVAEANRELNDEYRDWNDDMRETHRGDKGKQENPRGGNDYYFVQKRYKRERPIWYIPTKEEEHIDRLIDRGLI